MNTPAAVSQSPKRPRAVQKQIDEAAALITSLTTKPGEPVPGVSAAPVEPPPAAAAPAAPAAPAELPSAAAAPAASVVITPAEPDYKQMYGVLKGKYDKEVPELKALLGEANEKLRQTEALLIKATERPATPARATAKPGELPPPGSFTEEEMREYGPEFFNVVARRAQEIVDVQLGPLKAQLEEANKRLGHGARVEAERSRASVLLALDTEVPNWAALNTDTKFLAWLGESDVFSRRTKRELLTEAFESNDAARVVKFFKAFQEDPAWQPTAAARQPAVDPATLVAPGAPRNGGAPAAAPGGDDRVYTQQEIAEFYSQCRRGRITPDEKNRMERIFTRAAAEGRVR